MNSPSTFPASLEGEYYFIRCEKYARHSAAFFGVQKATGRQVLIKLAPSAEDGRTLRNEYDLLKRLEQLHAPAAALFPRAVECRELPEGFALIREYIPGQSLEAYVESEQACPGIDRDTAVRCVASVLEQLALLHSLNPPLIHRDIKPQNVIIDRWGKCHLIDLGIARAWQEDAAADTSVMGTGITAPPEQFGYRQTDPRSDIYSAGVLLRYCLTERYDEAADGEIDADLRRVVRKATQFDPKKRYRRAEDMLRALKPGRTPWRRRRAAVLALLALAATLACLVWLRLRPAGFTLSEEMFAEAPEIWACYKNNGMYPCGVRAYLNPDGLRLTAHEGDIRFSGIGWRRERLSGGALRAVLDALRDSGIPIHEIVLQNFRIEALDPLAAAWSCPLSLIIDSCALPEDWSVLGDMGDALERLCVSGEYDASDLSWMSSLTSLKWLALGGADMDLESILKMDWLPDVTLGQAGIEDLTPFVRMTNLTELSLPGNQIRDLSPLADMARLEYLYVNENLVEDLSPLAELKNLKYVDVTGNRIADFSPIERDGIEIVGRDEQRVGFR